MVRNIKTVIVKVFEPGNKVCRTRRCAALKGQRWTEHGIQQLLEFIASEIEVAMPLEEYELVELGAAAFNFVHRGARILMSAGHEAESFPGTLPDQVPA